jgi:hypothetical protein
MRKTILRFGLPLALAGLCLLLIAGNRSATPASSPKPPSTCKKSSTCAPRTGQDEYIIIENLSRQFISSFFPVR